jgi:hypothetical protein
MLTKETFEGEGGGTTRPSRSGQMSVVLWRGRKTEQTNGPVEASAILRKQTGRGRGGGAVRKQR